MITRLYPQLDLTYKPDFWNQPGVMEAVNCITYALNRPDLGWARPGKLALSPEEKLRKAQIFDATHNRKDMKAKERAVLIGKALIDDGLELITEEQALSGKFHTVSVWFGNNDDTPIHFLRRDADGTYSHKDERGPVTNVFGGKKIRNPREEFNNGFYPHFVGNFAIPAKGILIYPVLEIPDHACIGQP